MTPAGLKAARDALGLTQRGLAERLGVTQATIWRWEHGRTVEHPTILALALRGLVLDAQAEVRAAKQLLERVSPD